MGKWQMFVIKSADLLSQLAGVFWIVLDLIAEDGVVKCQAQADGMCGLHVCLADLKCVLVCFLCRFNDFWRQRKESKTIKFSK